MTVMHLQLIYSFHDLFKKMGAPSERQSNSDIKNTQQQQALFLNMKCATQKSFAATITVSCGCFRLILKAKGVGS